MNNAIAMEIVLSHTIEYLDIVHAFLPTIDPTPSFMDSGLHNGFLSSFSINLLVWFVQ